MIRKKPPMPQIKHNNTVDACSLRYDGDVEVAVIDTRLPVREISGRRTATSHRSSISPPRHYATPDSWDSQEFVLTIGASVKQRLSECAERSEGQSHASVAS